MGASNSLSLDVIVGAFLVWHREDSTEGRVGVACGTSGLLPALGRDGGTEPTCEPSSGSPYLHRIPDSGILASRGVSVLIKTMRLPGLQMNV